MKKEVKLETEKEIFYENMIVNEIIYSRIRTENFNDGGTVNIEWVIPSNGQLNNEQLDRIYEVLSNPENEALKNLSHEITENPVITAKSESGDTLYFDKQGNLIQTINKN